jgi:hypothetical protein
VLLGPGLIGWVVINLGMAAKQLEVRLTSTFSLATHVPIQI